MKYRDTVVPRRREGRGVTGTRKKKKRRRRIMIN